MRAGDFRFSVGFYKRVDVDDGYGNTQSVFGGSPEFPAVPAAIKPKLGGEGVQAARLEGRNFVNVTVAQSSETSSVTTDWRARDEDTGELYNIRSIIDPEKDSARQGRYLEMLCEKGVAI